MKHIVTETGFETDIDETRLDDMELFDAIVGLQGGDVTTIPLILSKVFGADKAALYEHCRTEDGRVPTMAVAAELTKVFEAVDEKK